MLLIVVDGNQEACHSQGRVVELPTVVNRCTACNGRIVMGEGHVFTRQGKGEGHEMIQKKGEK